MKNAVSILLLCLSLPAFGQTSLDGYRAAVADYSWQLKIAASQSDAAAETLGQARTGYLPRLAMDGSFTKTFHRYEGVEPWTFGVLPQVVQTVYGGGAVRASARQAELGYDIALCDEEFSRLDVRYAADYAYWNLSAVELYATSMRQYVSIIRSLKEVVDRRFAEGYIAKGDVLMIDARLSEAEYSLVSAEQSYEVALHNFNILRGTDAALDVRLQEWTAALRHDDIVREEMNGWTALVQSRAQVDATEESLRIAAENLSISTYSYGEGLATILDVLQAQLSWIQLYSNAIRAHYNYAVAVSDYQRITAHQTAVFLVREDDGAADLRLVVLGTALDVVNDMERGEYALRSEFLGGQLSREADFEPLGRDALFPHDHQRRLCGALRGGVEQQGLGVHRVASGAVCGPEFSVFGHL